MVKQEVDSLSRVELANAIRHMRTPIVLLFDPRDESKDQAFISALAELKPHIKIDFQQYPFEKREGLFYVYVDLRYFAARIAKELKSQKLRRSIDRRFEEDKEWVKVGSQAPITRFIRGFMEELKILRKPPWIAFSNIDVRTDVNHATIGSIVFDAITSPFSENVIISCTPESWTEFEKGHDIFARIASRLRSSVRWLD